MIKFWLFLPSFCLAFPNSLKFPNIVYSRGLSDKMNAYPFVQYDPRFISYHPSYGFRTYPGFFQYGRGPWGYPRFNSYLEAPVSRKRFYPTYHRPSDGYSSNHFQDYVVNRMNDNEYADGKHINGIYGGVISINENAANNKNFTSDSGDYRKIQEKEETSKEIQSLHESDNLKQQDNHDTENNENSSHKKGHVIRGFKNHHHKDEDAKTEEFYDESHDEGGTHNFGRRFGSFNRNSGKSIQSASENKNHGALREDVNSRYGSEHNSEFNAGERNELLKNLNSKINTFNFKNIVNEHSLLQNQERNKDHFNPHPNFSPYFVKL